MRCPETHSTDIQIIEICKLRKEIVLHTNSGRWKYGREPCCSHRYISKKRHEKNYNRDQQNCQCVFTFCRQEQRTANPAAMPTRQMIAAIVTLILLAMLIPLFITSFKSVRRKMNGKTWKNIQRMAYPFFIGIYVHIMVLYSADVNSHMTGIIVYTVIYACYVILRLRKAALKSRKTKIATA